MGIEVLYRKPNQQKASSASEQSVPVKILEGRMAQSDFGNWQYIYPHCPGLRLSGGRSRLALTQGIVMASLHRDRRAVLPGCGPGSCGQAMAHPRSSTPKLTSLGSQAG